MNEIKTIVEVSKTAIKNDKISLMKELKVFTYLF